MARAGRWRGFVRQLRAGSGGPRSSAPCAARRQRPGIPFRVSPASAPTHIAVALQYVAGALVSVQIRVLEVHGDPLIGKGKDSVPRQPEVGTHGCIDLDVVWRHLLDIADSLAILGMHLEAGTNVVNGVRRHARPPESTLMSTVARATASGDGLDLVSLHRHNTPVNGRASILAGMKGEILSNRYFIAEEVGVGGMGTVYRAV